MRGAKLNLLLTLFLASLALPPETWFFIGPVRLSPYRVVLIVALGFCAVRFLSGKAGLLRSYDLLMFSHVCWAVFALFLWAGFSEGLQPAGIYVVEAFGSYLLGRAYVRSADDFRRVISTLFWIIAVMLPFTLYEMWYGDHLIRNTFAAVLGEAPFVVDQWSNAARFGLTRAFGTFEHPIHYGLFCATIFAGVVYVVCKSKFTPIPLSKYAVVLLSVMTTVSSGPVLAVQTQLGLIFWDKVTKRIRGRWLILGAVFLILYVIVDILSNRTPLEVFISYLTFSSDTAYGRILIWDYGSAEVLKYPIFGKGPNPEWAHPDWMSSSMDNYWLLTALSYGIPAVILLLSAMLVMAIRLGRLRSDSDELLACRNAWIFMIAGISAGAATAHLWNAVLCLFFFLIGTGSWMIDHGRTEMANSKIEV